MQPNDIWEQYEADLSLVATKSYLTCSEAAKILKVSSKTIQRWEKAGKICGIRTPGNHRRFSVSEIKRLQIFSTSKHKKESSNELRAKNNDLSYVSPHEMKAVKNQLKILQVLLTGEPSFQTTIITIEKLLIIIFKLIFRFNSLKEMKKSCKNLNNIFNKLKLSFEVEQIELEGIEQLKDFKVSHSPSTSFAQSRKNASLVFENLLKSSYDKRLPKIERERAQKIINKIIQPYNQLSSHLNSHTPGTVEYDVSKLLLTSNPIDYGILKPKWSVRSLSEACKQLQTKSSSKSQVGRFYKEIGWCKSVNRKLISPDSEWGDKMKAIALTMLNLGKNDLLLYGDEFKFTSTKIKGYLTPKSAPKGLEFRLKDFSTSYFGPTCGIEMTGLLNPQNGKLVLTELKEKNFEGYVQQLKKVLSQFETPNKGKIYLIIDNGPIHGSDRLEKRLQKVFGPNVHVLYLPTYSPNQNPIERVWQTLLSSTPRICQTIKELHKSLNESLLQYKQKHLKLTDSTLKLHCPICSDKFIFSPSRKKQNKKKIKHHLCFSLSYFNPYIQQVLTHNLDKGGY